MAIFFFSDAHLGEGSPDNEKIKTEKLFSFFEMVKADGDKLYIIGDLFDFWFEYENAIPKSHLKVVFRLAAMVEEGIEVHYITGNHDFWLGDFLSREAGLVIHRDQHETVEQGKKLFLIHGDGLSPSDGGYRFLKKILRNRFNIWLYRKLPVDWGIPLAKYVAGKSRSHTSGRTMKFLQDYEEYAAAKLKEGYDAIVIGHLHQPVRKEFEKGLYLNSGDFIKHFSYLRMENGEFSLEYM